MAKLKNSQIRGVLTACEKLLDKDFKNVKTTLNLAKLARKTQEELKDFEKAKQKIMENYAEKDEEGNLIVLDSDGNVLKDGQGEPKWIDREKGLAKISELLEVEFDVECELVFDDSDGITAREILPLIDFVK